MNVYATESIRNVVLLGHGGCGKTSLIESMAFTTGIIKRVRTVTEGGTVSDYDKEEVKRKFSIQSSVIPLEVDGVKVNLLDTPGFFDFSGEVYEALSVADGAIIVINGKSGVEVGTRKSFEFCAKRGIPVIVYITCVEDEHVDASAIIDELRESYGNKIVPFHMPMKEGTEFKGFINAAKMLECRLQPNGTYYEKEVEEGVNEELDEYRQQLLLRQAKNLWRSSLQKSHLQKKRLRQRLFLLLQREILCLLSVEQSIQIMVLIFFFMIW